MMKNKTLSLLSTAAVLASLLFAAAPAAAQPQGLDIGKVRLNLAFQPGPKTPGRLFIRGIIDDNDTDNDDDTIRHILVLAALRDAGCVIKHNHHGDIGRY